LKGKKERGGRGLKTLKKSMRGCTTWVAVVVSERPRDQSEGSDCGNNVGKKQAQPSQRSAVGKKKGT